MNNRKMRLAGMGAALVLAITSFVGTASAQEIRLAARKNKVINGVEAQLRGDYRDRGTSQRLNSELENINIPVGTKVAFCLLKDGVKSLVGVGTVTMVAGIPTAFVELNTNDGQVVPSVSAGDVLQARQRKIAPFRASPTCGTALLVSAAFR